MKKILGIGNALTDILIKLKSDEELQKLDLKKASMSLVSQEKVHEVLTHFESYDKSIMSGGSTCNTIRSIAHLGVETGYIGKIGHDEYGEHFINDLKKIGVKPQMFYSNTTKSGKAVALISPDAERTFTTYLGAALELNADDLKLDYFKGYDIIHIEGYLVQNHDLVRQTIKLAKEAGLKISSDMPGYNIIEEDRDFVMEIIDNVDIVFANEEETKAIINKSPEETLDFLAAKCDYAFVKLGKNGSLLKHGDEKIHIEAKKVKSIDSTGAGDNYAAGALCAICKGYDLRRTGEIGSLVAEYVIQNVGPQLTDSQWKEILPI